MMRIRGKVAHYTWQYYLISIGIHVFLFVGFVVVFLVPLEQYALE